MVIQAASKLDRILPNDDLSGHPESGKSLRHWCGRRWPSGHCHCQTPRSKVEAFDTRPVVAEQVQSLGAKFLEIDLGEIGQTKDGTLCSSPTSSLNYSVSVCAKRSASQDIVITTAQVFGRAAPRIVTGDMVAAMKLGGVIVDMAVDPAVMLKAQHQTRLSTWMASRSLACRIFPLRSPRMRRRCTRPTGQPCDRILGRGEQAIQP